LKISWEDSWPLTRLVGVRAQRARSRIDKEEHTMSDDSKKLEDMARPSQQDEARDEVEGHVSKFKATDDGGEDSDVEAHLHRAGGKSDAKAL
jgi:hypothetical protein